MSKYIKMKNPFKQQVNEFWFANETYTLATPLCEILEQTCEFAAPKPTDDSNLSNAGIKLLIRAQPGHSAGLQVKLGLEKLMDLTSKLIMSLEEQPAISSS